MVALSFLFGCKQNNIGKSTLSPGEKKWTSTPTYRVRNSRFHGRVTSTKATTVILTKRLPLSLQPPFTIPLPHDPTTHNPTTLRSLPSSFVISDMSIFRRIRSSLSWTFYKEPFLLVRRRCVHHISTQPKVVILPPFPLNKISQLGERTRSVDVAFRDGTSIRSGKTRRGFGNPASFFPFSQIDLSRSSGNRAGDFVVPTSEIASNNNVA